MASRRWKQPPQKVDKMFTLLVPHALAYTLMFLVFNTTMHNNVQTHIKQPPVTQKSKRRNSKKQKTKYQQLQHIASNSNSNGNNNKFNKLCFFFHNVAFFFQRKEKKQHNLITQTLCRQSMSGGASLTHCLTLSFLILLLNTQINNIDRDFFLLYFTITTHRHLKMPKPLYGEQTNQ